MPAAQLRGAAFILGCPAQVAHWGWVVEVQSGEKGGRWIWEGLGCRLLFLGGLGTQLWCECPWGGGHSSSPNPQPRGVLLQLSTEPGCLYEPICCGEEHLNLEEGACLAVSLKSLV